MINEHHLQTSESQSPLFINPHHPDNVPLIQQQTLVFPDTNLYPHDSYLYQRLCLEYPLGIQPSDNLPVVARRQLHSVLSAEPIGFNTVEFLPGNWGNISLSVGITCGKASMRAYYDKDPYLMCLQGHVTMPDHDPIHFTVNPRNFCLKFDGAWHQFPPSTDMTKIVQTTSGYQALIKYLTKGIYLQIAHRHQGVTQAFGIDLPYNIPFTDWHREIEEGLFKAYINDLSEHAQSYLNDTDYMQRPLTEVKRASCAVIGHHLLGKLQQTFPIYGVVSGTMAA
ncbi:MAG: hypothetical protein NUV52_00355 [Candidatus Roizmanbacteria bacterium]|nr:hypothetical protein [Candidatus Roizmanbacteria bacterium]